MKKKKVLVTLGSGGHTAQTILLIDRIHKLRQYDYIYLIQDDDSLSKDKIKIPGKIIKTKRTRNFGEFHLIAMFRAVWQIFYVMRIFIKKKDIDAVLSTGPGIAIPVCLAGKFFKKKIIYIETWSRISKLSLAGIIMKYVADLYFVQWKKNKKNNKRAIYAGLIY